MQAHADIEGGNPFPSGAWQAPQPYRVTLFWFVLCWMAALLALGGLAALQQLVPEDAAAWAVFANLPVLWRAAVFRFDWYTVMLQLTRTPVCCFLVAAAVLTSLSTDRLLNASEFLGAGAYAASRCAAVGFLVAAVTDFSLCYMLGLQALPLRAESCGVEVGTHSSQVHP